MPNRHRYPPEIREHAVRLVFEHEHEYPSQWKANCSIAEKSDSTERPSACLEFWRRGCDNRSERCELLEPAADIVRDLAVRPLRQVGHEPAVSRSDG